MSNGEANRPLGTAVAESRVPKRVARYMREAAFDTVIKQPGFFYQSLAEWEDVIERVLGYAERAVEQSSLDTPFKEAELAHLAAGRVNWRVPGSGRQLEWKPYDIDSDAQATALTPFLKAKGDKYASWIDMLPSQALNELLNASVVLNKGKGAPLYIPGSDVAGGALLCKAAFTAYATDGLDGVTALAESLRQGGVGLLMTMYRRIQGGRKPVDWYLRDESGWLSVKQRAILAKVRDVKASPSLLNMLTAPATAVVKWCQRCTSSAHDGSALYAGDAFTAFHGAALAVDFSTFDDTVSWQTRAAWRKYVLEPCCAALKRAAAVLTNVASDVRHMVDVLCDAAVDIDEWGDTAPLLIPPRHEGEVACVVQRRGGIRSGEYNTSVKGSDIASAAGEFAIMATGGRGYHINQSDDQLFFGASPDVEKAMADIALVATTPAEPAYLMRHLPGAFMYLGRALAGVINSEVASEPRTWLAATASVSLRFQALRGHPLANVFAEALNQHPNTASISSNYLMDGLSAANLASLTAQAGEAARYIDKPGPEYAALLGYSGAEADEMASLIDAASVRSQLPIDVILRWPWRRDPAAYLDDAKKRWAELCDE